jgi:hypothetical protein
MAEARPLAAIRSALRGAKAFASSPDGYRRFQELLAEARQQCPDREAWNRVLAELGMSERV